MRIDADAVAAYRRDGFLLVDDLFTADEIAVMVAACDTGRAAEAWDAPDASGLSSRLSLWSELGDDVWAAAATCPRVADSLRILMGEDIAFFHGKVMMKTAGTPGSVEWHQDYGYWYDQGFPFPRMASVWFPLDAATRQNGCLEVLRGSHRLGRLEHRSAGSQTGAEASRLEFIRPLFEHLALEMRPGSALFFDSLLLHGSGPNRSAAHRRAAILCYNALANLPLHPTPSLQRRCPTGSDDAILAHARAIQPAR